MTITIDEQIACVEREIKLRRRVYPRRIEHHFMTRKFATEQIAAMEAVLETVKTARATGPGQIDLIDHVDGKETRSDYGF